MSDIITAMLWLLINRSFLKKIKTDIFKNFQKNFEEHLILQKRCLITLNARSEKSIHSCEVHRQGAKKFDKKLFVPSTNDYLKSHLKSASLNENGTILFVNFENLDKLDFPLVWLRDNCQCSFCFDPISNSKIHKPLEFNHEIIPASVYSVNDSVSIVWEDKHISTFQKDWLCRHSFHVEHQNERMNKQYIQQISWNSEDLKNMLPSICFRFDDILKEDYFLLKWLETLATVGISKIFDVPLECGQLQKLAKRVAYIRKTHYGEEYYITGDNNASNVAYNRGPLQMHTDLPYYHYTPGVVLLHFVMQSTDGGENIIADGLNVVQQISKTSYKILSKTLVDWVDIGTENNEKFYSLCRAPVICEDYLGNIEKINWSQPQRDSFFNVTPELAIEWYKAFKDFKTRIDDSKNCVIIKNAEGSILTFDNRRVLHGRTDFKNKRFLCGAYMDWDEIYSKIRVLRQNVK